MIFTVLIFIIILSVLVFVHEIGHFMAARKFGVKVEEFGLGLPPRLAGLQKNNGHWRLIWGKKEISPSSATIYSLNWFPIGGFVKIKGENGEDGGDLDSFTHQSLGRRAIILFAGVLMNVFLCVALLTIGFNFGLPAIITEEMKGATFSQSQIQVIELMETMPAQLAGLEVGDTIVAINGQSLASINEMQNYLKDKDQQLVAVEIERRGEFLVYEMTVVEHNNIIGIGVGLIQTALVRYPWYLSIWHGLRVTVVWLVTIISVLFLIVRNLLVGLPTGVEVAGPIGIAFLTNEVTQLGLVYLLQFTAILSLNLAIINILPFPALDGGRILFLMMEKIRGRAMNRKWEVLTHNIGFILLMLLIGIVTYQDILKNSGRIIGWFKKVFFG